MLQNPAWVARQYCNWWTSLRIDDRTQWPLERSYRDLWMLIRFYMLPVSYHVYVVIQLALAAATAAVCAWRRAGCQKLARAETAQRGAFDWRSAG